MTKQQEIREGIADLIWELGERLQLEFSTRDESLLTNCATRIVSYLHSQGVVIGNGGTCVIGDLSVEPLIKEE